MKELSLKIKGMHCTGCSTRLEKVLNNQDGVEDAKVSFEEAKAEIKLDFPAPLLPIKTFTFPKLMSHFLIDLKPDMIIRLNWSVVSAI